MTLAGLLLFVGVYMMAVASPGPAVATVMARALARGLRGLPAFIAGIAVGDLVWFAVAALGLAVIAQNYAVLLTIIKYAGAAYLLYLAWKLWRSPATTVGADTPSPPDEKPWRLFLGGLALTLGNPKPIVFFVAILPTIVDLPTLTLLGMGEIAIVIPMALSLVLGGYALAADRARRLFSRSSSIQILNRATAVVMAGAAAAVARA